MMMPFVTIVLASVDDVDSDDDELAGDDDELDSRR